MKTDTKALLEFVGIVAVVLSLLFVGLQLQQANNIAGREARTEILSLSMELNSIVFENVNTADLYLKLRNPNPELSDREAELAFWLTNLHANFWGAMVGAVGSGLLPDGTVRVYEENVRRTFIDYPGICPFVPIGIRNSPATAPPIMKIVVEEIEKLGCQPWTFR